jgi:hypothetical protein
MSNRLRAVDPSVEVLEWVDTSSLSSLVAGFARIHMLLAVFDGNPDRWLDMINAEGTAEEREGDAKFLFGLKKRLAENPRLIDELRTVVREFARLMA